MPKIKISDGASCQLGKAPKRTNDKIGCQGVFSVEVVRGGKTIRKDVFNNAITNEGKDHLLDVAFSGATQISSWYLGLVDDTGYSALAAGDTYDNIDQAGNGWDEFADYTDPGNSDSAVTRPGWTEGGPSSQSITNSTQVSFDITASGTVKGLFLAGGPNAQTKSDHTASGNVLWSAALFSGGDVAVADGDELKVTYTINA